MRAWLNCCKTYLNDMVSLGCFVSIKLRSSRWASLALGFLPQNDLPLCQKEKRCHPVWLIIDIIVVTKEYNGAFRLLYQSTVVYLKASLCWRMLLCALTAFPHWIWESESWRTSSSSQDFFIIITLIPFNCLISCQSTYTHFSSHNWKLDFR